MTRPVLIAAAVIAVGTAAFFGFRPALPSPQPDPTPTPSAVLSPTPAVSAPTADPPPASSQYVEPIAEFRQRITKKSFGTYITPENSPVQPERFRGYHTGVDVEYEDADGDIPVRAVASGNVVRSGRVSGYGGLVVIEHTTDNRRFFTLYGHLDPSSLPTLGTTVEKAQQLGMLGEGGTQETDGERRHLHFAVITSTTADVRGYVASRAELGSWQNPLEFFQ